MTRSQRNRRRNSNCIGAKSIAQLASSTRTSEPIPGDRVYIKRSYPQFGGRAGTILATERRFGGLQLRLHVDGKGWRVSVSLADTIPLDEGMARPMAEAHDINERPYGSVFG